MGYFDILHRAFQQVQCDIRGESISYDAWVSQLLKGLLHAKESGKMLFFIGNGGSAGISIHMTADFLKNGGMRTHSMHDASTLTCLGNDFGYEYVFNKQLEMVAQSGDILVAISSSGNSPNIVKAVKTAQEMECVTVTLSGFGENNAIRSMGDYNLYVPSKEYGIVESAHNAILQHVVDELMERNQAE